MAQITVFLVVFRCKKTNRKRWINQSMDFRVANAVCKQLAADGNRPQLVRQKLDTDTVSLQPDAISIL
jgi:hypothetical protein